jgi:hypothetical protein
MERRNPKRKDFLEDLGVNGKTISERFLKEQKEGCFRIHGIQYVHNLLLQFHSNNNCDAGSHTERNSGTIR